MADTKVDGVKLFAETKDAKSEPETAKFIPDNDSQNGLSPITVESVKVAFTGLTKEELMKYANDPFWVRVRWILFTLFWVIWLCMLFGAVFIIIITPKCKEETAPTWWQSSPLYILDVAELSKSNPNNTDASVIAILKDRINHLKDLGVESLMLTNVLQTNNNAYEEVSNFTNVNYYLDSVDKFRTEIIEYAKTKDINVILSFVPNHSGRGADSFIRSINEAEWKDFYIWYPGNHTEQPENAPNNWMSVYNNSAWKWHDTRKQFYLHQFKEGQPDFNFWNPAVIEFFDKVFKFWFEVGVNNFHIHQAEFLYEDRYYENETVVSPPGYTFNDYDFYSHHRTCDLPETQNILSKWSELVRNRSGFFGVSGGVREKLSIADLLTKPVVLEANFNATQLDETIISRRKTITEKNVWEWTCSRHDDTNCYSPHVADGLLVVAFLLPGTPVLKCGQELNDSKLNVYNVKEFNESKMAAEKSAESRLKLIQSLIRLRSLPAFVHGDYKSIVLNTNVFTFTRIKSGTPGHLVAWNLGQNETVVNFKVLPMIPEELIVVLKAGNAFNNATYVVKNRLSSSRVTIPPLTAFVFSFVPVDGE